MDFSKMMKQAQQMQKQMSEVQKRIEEMESEGISGGGLISIVLSGKGEMKKISINDSLVKEDEIDILEDLIIAAHNDALKKLEARKSQEMDGVSGGLKLPSGFGL